MFWKKQEGFTADTANSMPVITNPSHSYRWVALIVAVVALLGAGGAFAYYKFVASDDLLLQKALRNFDQIKSFKYSGEVKITGSSPRATALASSLLGSNRGDISALIEFRGSSDVADVTKPKAEIKTDVTFMDPNRPISTSFEARTLGEVSYIYIGGLATTIMELLGKNEALGSFIGGIDLRPLQENWIKLDKGALRDKLNFSAAYQQKLNEVESKKLTKEQIETLKRSFSENKVIKITAKLGKETVDGIETKGFEINFDKNGLKKFLAKVEEVTGEKIPDDLRNELATSTSNISNFNLRIWLDRNGFLRKTTISASQTSFNGASSKIAATIFVKDYNQPVTIEVPTNIIDLNQIIEQIMGKYSYGSTYQASTFSSSTSSPYSSSLSSSTVDSDKDGLDDYLEEMFGTDPDKADTDGDGFTDGQEVAQGFNPLGKGKMSAAQLKLKESLK